MENHYSEKWILVGQSAQNSLLVRGGLNPISIQVKHHDSSHLHDLIADANAGIEARLAAKNTR